MGLHGAFYDLWNAHFCMHHPSCGRVHDYDLGRYAERKGEDMRLEGRVSCFGGPDDEYMKFDEGLALYEHAEANKRLDLFYLRGTDLRMATNTRLNPDAYYIAVRYPGGIDRAILQASIWWVKNPETDKVVRASLVDWGPALWTNRVADLSPGIVKELGIKTDDIAIISCETI